MNFGSSAWDSSVSCLKLTHLPELNDFYKVHFTKLSGVIPPVSCRVFVVVVVVFKGERGRENGAWLIL